MHIQGWNHLGKRSIEIAIVVQNGRRYTMYTVLDFFQPIYIAILLQFSPKDFLSVFGGNYIEIILGHSFGENTRQLNMLLKDWIILARSVLLWHICLEDKFLKANF